MTDPHGGNLDYAIAKYGGRFADWLDLSTGINLRPYPFIDVSKRSFNFLPQKCALEKLDFAARLYYNIPNGVEILPVAGVQDGIQTIPFMKEKGLAKILSPTYSEYETVLKKFGWKVKKVYSLNELKDADIAILVNPNNPDGRIAEREKILDAVSGVQEIIIDESFGDLYPELSMVSFADQSNITVFKSFGKFFGLPGVRLGFVIGNEKKIRALKLYMEPWQVSGPAIEIGTRALSDKQWIRENHLQLKNRSRQLSDILLKAENCRVVGSTGLFHLIHTNCALETQKQFAKNQIWTRIFDYSENWLRIGTPGCEESLSKFEYALRKISSPF